MYYLQKYVFIDHTNSMMQINDTHQIFGFLIGLSPKLVVTTKAAGLQFFYTDCFLTTAAK